jgi:hypothetical protein
MATKGFKYTDAAMSMDNSVTPAQVEASIGELKGRLMALVGEKCAYLTKPKTMTDYGITTTVEGSRTVFYPYAW